MATSDDPGPAISSEHIERLTANLGRVEELSRRLVDVMAHKSGHNPALDGPNQQLFAQAAAAYWHEAINNPARIIEQQVAYWGKTVTHFAEAQQAMLKGAALQAPEDPGPKDARFRNPLWDTHPYFNFIKQQYQINAKAIQDAVEAAEDMDAKEKKRLAYFARQIVDLMAPTNFLATNPDALEKAVSTEGQSLVAGLENLVRDLEANDGELVVRLADETAFELGKNIATSKGQVVYRNRMIELIQYEAQTEKVHETPIVIFPPWINKFYIL
ncbi:MAG: class I poly(R)-hydroxyalkanoic acid synthase, partial [Pseudooceanicola sp.]|nr:class I poly(R)-hydroxyalkanoic acid synthase [Pseudooceanicola sp.]